MRRWLTPALLLVLAVAGTVLALQVPASDRPARGGPEPDLAAPQAAVLSVRRVPGLLATAVADSRLHGQLAHLLADPGLGRAATESCLVVEQGERRIMSLRPSASLIPASNLKVLTGAAALAELKSGTRLVTEVRADGPVRDGILDGRLWLVGGGDPLLATADYVATLPNQPQPFTALEALADKVVAAGIREVRGAVAGDEQRYDTVRYVPSWRSSYIANHEIGPMSALTVNDGFSSFGARMVSAADPATHAAAVLTRLLQARGVVVAAGPTQGRVPSDATKVASLESLTVGEIVTQMLIESDNLTAELLVKELGYRVKREGATEAGLQAVRDVLARRHAGAGGLVAVDGSGLDRSDRANCELLHDAIDLAGPSSPLAQGFPVAGRTGTLAKRFKGNPAEGRLRAKTGSLDFVAALTGFVDGTAGGPLEFAFVANGLPDRAERGRLLQEQIGAVLARYPEGPTAAELGPGA